ncbi:MAG TPA: magnesium transporter CorA family protein [Patescibacteria group bacterium]|nr:magnesium transporter CorA family protein [Patescibacteria group bacterium]
MALKIIHTKNLKWVDIVNPDESDILYLKENFRFHPLDFEDVVGSSARAKIDEYDSYHFLILLFPFSDKVKREIRPAEVDFFLGKDYLVTVHDGSMKTLVNLTKNISQYDNVRNQYMGANSGYLLFSILELLFKRSFPILDNLNREIVQAGRDAFEIDITTPHKLSQLKKNIIVYRRIMKMHKFILGKLSRSKRDYIMFKDSKAYFQNLIETAENIWDMLASDKESVESYEGTNQTLASHQIEDILKVLTIVSVVVSILTFITDFMIFFDRVTIEKYFHIADDVQFFVILLTLMIVMVVGLLVYFRRKRWL